MKRIPGDPQAIHTASWFTSLPRGFSRVGISRSTPRGYKKEHWIVNQLAPGPWFKTVPPETYLKLYNNILAKLNPQHIADALFASGPNPVMVCYESAIDINAGTKFCHRHLAAKWLSDLLGIQVQEIQAPADFRQFKAFERLGIEVPRYEPGNILAGG